MNNFCSWCGTKIFEDDRSCPACGAWILKEKQSNNHNEIDSRMKKYIQEHLDQFDKTTLSQKFKRKFSLDTIMSNIENTIWERWTK